MPEPPTFVLAADFAYVKPLAAALRSLLAQSKTPSRFVVFHDGFTQSTIDRVLPPQTRDETAHDVEWLRIDGAALDNTGARPAATLTRASLVRLMLPDWLPSVRKVVYVDADCLAVTDPYELWSINLRGSPIAAVRDPWWSWAGSPGAPFPWEELGIRPSQPYYNDGVLVLDLARWRSESLGESCFRLIREHIFVDTDQAAINAILGEVCMPLPPRWNLQPMHLDPRRNFAPIFEDPELLLEALANPAIIHFSGAGGSPRPWHPGCGHPYVDLWYGAIDSTGWSGWRPTQESLPPRRRYIANIRGRLRAVARAAIGRT